MSAFKLQVKNEHDCVLLNIVELDGTIVTLLKISDTEMSALSLKYNGTRLHSVCGDTKYILKTQQQCLFTEILARLLQMIQRPRHEQFHEGTVSYPYCHAEGRVGGGISLTS